MPIPKEIVDWGILSEIVSMDEDDPEFSKSLIIQFLDQAQTTFEEMQAQLQGPRELKTLADLGHFLKGSSSALGLQRIAWVCERIQNLGRKKENTLPAQEYLVYQTTLENPYQGNYYDRRIGDCDEEVLLALIARALDQARYEFSLARAALSTYYGSEL